MNFLKFQNTFANLPVISVAEIEKVFPGFDRNALTRWQEKGFLLKIRNGFYRLASQSVKGDADLFFIANRIYTPSYISLQSAWRFYDFIPEGVFSVTSVSTLKTASFETSFGHFAYRSIKPELFWGYRLEPYLGYRIKMADPAKAVLDFLYLHPRLDSEDHFFELRLNVDELMEKLDLRDLDRYLDLFGSRSLRSRARKFLQFISNHAHAF